MMSEANGGASVSGTCRFPASNHSPGGRGTDWYPPSGLLGLADKYEFGRRLDVWLDARLRAQHEGSQPGGRGH